MLDLVDVPVGVDCSVALSVSEPVCVWLPLCVPVRVALPVDVPVCVGEARWLGVLDGVRVGVRPCKKGGYPCVSVSQKGSGRTREQSHHLHLQRRRTPARAPIALTVVTVIVGD